MIAASLLLIGFVWAIGSVYYQMVVRPFAYDATRFDLFAIRDELRMKAIQGEVDSQSFAFRHLEEMLNKMVHLCHWYSVSAIIESLLQRPTKHPDFDRFDNEATPLLKEFEERALGRMMIVMAANSPGWVIVSAGIQAITFLSKKCNPHQWAERENRVIWHDDATLTPA